MSGQSNERRLRADCEHCFALCCVAPAFSASADFAFDKPAGKPCLHLQTDFRCHIHDRLRPEGFAGCTVFDCFGAGQQVAQVTFRGRDWRQHPELAREMFEVFAIMRQLHELLWYLTEALRIAPSAQHPELRRALAETERLSHKDAEALLDLDLAAHRQQVNALLRRTSESVRTSSGWRGPDRSGADLIGRLGAFVASCESH